MHAERADVMTGAPQRAHDVIFCFPLVDFLLAVPLTRIRGQQVRVNEHQDAQLFHSAIHLRRDGPNNACIVLAVNSTETSVTSLCSGPTARRLSARQRAIMSSSTASSVS